MHFVGAIDPVIAVGAQGRIDKPDLLVIADCLGRQARAPGDLGLGVKGDLGDGAAASGHREAGGGRPDPDLDGFLALLATLAWAVWQSKRETDVDLLVDLDKRIGLFALARLERELSDLLGADVEVVPASSLREHARSSVLAYAVPV